MNLRVDQISLKLTGVSESESRRLGLLVARRLADADLGPLAAQERESVVVRAAADRGGTLEDLSGRIVEQILAQLGRSL